ncbi:ABC transporter ATP-binding protein [Schaalia sp. 19OD2882]|uniref:ABC transporter ATP-binding protein n=1 Tax=Schaalia sp. 19OD2882 TaxID=2794089 RepID=UPI001C1EDCFC|nr:ABC transporter ATP-binding protein [Schaalia sp. 19OD2882]QWW19357.1 ABC transporter ATP-binding protein [Schaalia sp. 19OD2882]
MSTRWVEVLMVLALQVAATVAALELPGLNARIIDEGVAKADTETIWRLGVWMLLLTLGQAVATAIAVFLGSRISMGMGAWLRHRIFTHAQEFSAQDMRHFGAASLVTRSTNDVQQVQMVVLMAFAIMVQAPIMGIGGLFMAVRQDAKLSLLFLVMIPVLALLIGILMRFLGPQFALQQTRIDQMNTVLREELTGVRVVRAFVRQPFMAQRYTDANDALKKVAMTIGALFALMFPLVGLVISASNIAVIWYGGHLIDTGDMEVGSLFAFINYVGMIFMAVMMSSMIFIMVPRAAIAATRVGEVIDHEPSVRTPASPVVPQDATSGPSAPDKNGRGRWTFSFEDMSLQYPGAEDPVLSGIDLTLTPGTTTAVIGSTGSGKTTLVNLLPRLMDPTGGQVLANGVPVDAIDLDLLRSRIAMVPQKTHLFSGTIASNVSGVEHPDAVQRERVAWALRGARASEFVDRLDLGIDSPVEPGGKNFSGGQRQRLSIARALYRDADLYIFDDSFSALDAATDAALRRSLHEYTGRAAVLVVAQRVASIKDATTIIVLEDGRIVGRGSHALLLGTCNTYREIVASQKKQEDAA